MNTKTEKPKFFGKKTEKTDLKIAKTAKSKISMPPLLKEGDFKATLSRKDAKNIFIC